MKGKKSTMGTATSEIEPNRCDEGSNWTIDGTPRISNALNVILADVFALYLKTKNFYWHMSGPHFVEYHSSLDEQGRQMLAMADSVARRVRNMGANTLKSIGDVARRQHVLDNDAEYVDPLEMLAELAEDNRALSADLRRVKQLCVQSDEAVTLGFVEIWIEEAERRAWLLSRRGRPNLDLTNERSHELT
jgi:starvation-inducible DNA-binding protein